MYTDIAQSPKDELQRIEKFLTLDVIMPEFIYVYDMDVAYDVGSRPLRKTVVRLQQEMKDRGLWAVHLPPHLGGRCGLMTTKKISARFS